jgi:hypothetical protein
MEIWKDIKGFEGLYQVSNTGLVKSMKKEWISGRSNAVLKKEESILKHSINSGGYCNLVLRKNGKYKTISIHRLVAIHFIENTDNYECVDHIDGNKLNNHFSNLRWCTKRQNNSFENKIFKKDKSSIYTGVRLHKFGKWQARIVVNKKQISLGYFDKEEEAAEAYINYTNQLIKG